jgi:hypothetical protein
MNFASKYKSKKSVTELVSYKIVCLCLGPTSISKISPEAVIIPTNNSILFKSGYDLRPYKVHLQTNLTSLLHFCLCYSYENSTT